MAKKTRKKKNPVGRPREFFLTDEQLEQMDEMAFNQCKHRTIATALGVEKENLVNNYLPRLHKKGALGRVDLRASQRKMSKSQPSMAIFLGKNELEQADKQEIGGIGGGPVKVSIVDFGNIKIDGDTKQPIS